jgi:hypothetical protein
VATASYILIGKIKSFNKSIPRASLQLLKLVTYITQEKKEGKKIHTSNLLQAKQIGNGDAEQCTATARTSVPLPSARSHELHAPFGRDARLLRIPCHASPDRLQSQSPSQQPNIPS